MNNLAWLIYNGLGTRKDIKKAIEIYECAAANGNTRKEEHAIEALKRLNVPFEK